MGALPVLLYKEDAIADSWNLNGEDEQIKANSDLRDFSVPGPQWSPAWRSGVELTNAMYAMYANAFQVENASGTGPKFRPGGIGLFIASLVFTGVFTALALASATLAPGVVVAAVIGGALAYSLLCYASVKHYPLDGMDSGTKDVAVFAPGPKIRVASRREAGTSTGKSVNAEIRPTKMPANRADVGALIVRIAQKEITTPKQKYLLASDRLAHRGGHNTGGWDCSLLAAWCCQKAGVPVATVESTETSVYSVDATADGLWNDHAANVVDWADNSGRFYDHGQLRAGDLVFFRDHDFPNNPVAEHVGIFTGTYDHGLPQMISALKKGVGYSTFGRSNTYWGVLYIGATRPADRAILSGDLEQAGQP